GGHVGVLGQLVRHRAGGARDDARIAVVSRGRLLDGGGGRGMVVAPREEGGPRRAAERGRVEPVEAQPFGGELVHRGRRDQAAERAELTEAGIVDQDQDDVRGALRRSSGLRELRRGGGPGGRGGSSGEGGGGQ